MIGTKIHLFVHAFWVGLLVNTAHLHAGFPLFTLVPFCFQIILAAALRNLERLYILHLSPTHSSMTKPKCSSFRKVFGPPLHVSPPGTWFLFRAADWAHCYFLYFPFSFNIKKDHYFRRNLPLPWNLTCYTAESEIKTFDCEDCFDIQNFILELILELCI